MGIFNEIRKISENIKKEIQYLNLKRKVIERQNYEPGEFPVDPIIDNNNIDNFSISSIGDNTTNQESTEV